MSSSGSSGSLSGCPINHEADSCPMAHSQRLNPKNNELPPNQQPASGQRKALPTERATSTIPTGASGGEPLWVYPSQQMFYNAMKRKGYSPHEEEMEAVVAIHNTVNERAWAEVIAWEATLHPECTAELKLLRFRGRPDELTLKARANSLLGYTRPFDRHDWVVSRCGKEVTYLLDFYNGKVTRQKPVAMHIDARPDATDMQGVLDRLRMPLMQMWLAATGR